MLTHSTLRPRATSRTTTKRLWRGSSSWKWGFCGRGCKGQKARTGKKIHPLFEWGQTPLHLKLPKLRGGSLKRKENFSVIHLSDLQKLSDAGNTSIDLALLIQTWLVRGNSSRVKLLSGGELTSSVTVSVHAVSETARTIVEKTWGTLSLVV